MWPWRVKMSTQCLLRLLKLLMLMLRNVLTIVWCRLGRWSLVIKSTFCPDFEHKLWSRLKLRFRHNFEAEVKFSQYFAADPWLRLWRLFLVEILKLGLVRILKFKFSRNADIGLRFWSCCFVGSMKMKSDRDFFENLWFDQKKFRWSILRLQSIIIAWGLIGSLLGSSKEMVFFIFIDYSDIYFSLIVRKYD